MSFMLINAICDPQKALKKWPVRISYINNFAPDIATSSVSLAKYPERATVWWSDKIM